MAAKDLFGNEQPDETGPEQFRLRDETTIDEIHLKDANEETQMEAMRSWFREHFQDPVEETPYDSSEGGYIYIYGGPYDPREELDARFGDIVSEEVIEKLAYELGNESWEWEGRPGPGDYDDYVLSTIAPPSEHIARFGASIENIRKLIKTPVDQAEEQFFRRMLFASVITALETYLSDRFVSSVTNNPKALRKFVESYPRFKDEGFKLSDIFRKYESLERQTKSMLLGELVWHRLMSISKMFKDTFDVDFADPEDMKELLRAIDIRHDLVHRSGRTKDGDEHTITPEKIEKLIVDTDKLVLLVDAQDEKFNFKAQEASSEEESKGGGNDVVF
jgi:RiboL-PSP-HEPN